MIILLLESVHVETTGEGCKIIIQKVDFIPFCL